MHAAMGVIMAMIMQMPLSYVLFCDVRWVASPSRRQVVAKLSP